MACHVHILFDTYPKLALSKLVNTLKTISSRQLRKEFAGHLKKFYSKPVLWSRSYCIVSAGGAPLSVIKRYIENQNGGIYPDTGGQPYAWLRGWRMRRLITVQSTLPEPVPPTFLIIRVSVRIKDLN
ncbi:MAG: IS200/IS605 family transposase [Desulfobacteraceae bacterium]|nr:IS200/IS605 family transposase [Desulfobacteraceae bacterium]